MRGRLQHISYVSELKFVNGKKKGVQTLNEPTTYSLRVVSKRNKYYSRIIIVICFEERLQEKERKTSLVFKANRVVNKSCSATSFVMQSDDA